MKFNLSAVAFGVLHTSLLFTGSNSFQTSSLISNSQRRLHLSSSLASSAARVRPGSAELDTPWEELGFEFRPTNSHVKLVYKDGEWGKPELVQVSVVFENISSLCFYCNQSSYVLTCFYQQPQTK